MQWNGVKDHFLSFARKRSNQYAQRGITMPSRIRREKWGLLSLSSFLVAAFGWLYGQSAEPNDSTLRPGSSGELSPVFIIGFSPLARMNM
jgi:hypothetical protein